MSDGSTQTSPTPFETNEVEEEFSCRKSTSLSSVFACAFVRLFVSENVTFELCAFAYTDTTFKTLCNHVRVYTYMDFVSTYTYIYIHTYLSIYLYIYTHTYIYIQTWVRAHLR